MFTVKVSEATLQNNLQNAYEAYRVTYKTRMCIPTKAS